MRTVGFLVFPGFEILDVFGPVEMFGMFPEEFKLLMIAEEAGPVASGMGPPAIAEVSTSGCPALDFILVPGGPGARKEVSNSGLLKWLAETAETTELVLSVCTGSALLARAGLLDGVKATTNKAVFGWVEAQGPKTLWQKQARWVEDGKFVSSSGVSAGMDMSLAVIARLLGQEKAEQAAVWAEYDWHQDASWDPFAEIHGLV